MLQRIWQLLGEFRRMPRASVDLRYAQSAQNDRFYAEMVQRHYREARGRHPRDFLIRRMEYGVALCRLPQRFEDYFMEIDGSARRNYKKASREGCSFREIDFNDHLDEIRGIRQSSEVRQGRLVPAEFRQGVVRTCQHPPTRSRLHAYPYFGVFREGRLLAYAGCMIAGEICCLEQQWGHADHLPLGIVPFLIAEIARLLYQRHPQVRYYAYGMYFGAGVTMQRFKRKFGFVPHRVTWLLDGPQSADPSPAAAARVEAQVS